MQVIGRIFQAKMNFHQAKLLNRSSQSQNQNDHNLPFGSESFTDTIKMQKKTGTFVTKSCSNTSKKKMQYYMIIRKEISYLLKETKKSSIEEVDNRRSISNSNSLICLNDHSQANVEAL